MLLRDRARYEEGCLFLQAWQNALERSESLF
jgi:hypothetical protein